MNNPSRDTVILNGSVLTGDGKTWLEKASIRLRGGVITEIREGTEVLACDTDTIDASGCTILPGIINAHAHGCVHGPSMPSGSASIARSDIAYFRNRHLLSGTTTLLNVCGLITADDMVGDGMQHPMDIQVSAAHTPSNIAAALAIDGAGLSARHREMTIEAMIANGAKALGEAGGGQTLGGGAQDYRFIPRAISDATGLNVHPAIARRLKEAVLGRTLDGQGAANDAALTAVLQESGLDGYFSVTGIRDLITRTVMPPVQLSLQGLLEIAVLSERFAMPAIFHTAVPTIATLLEIARDHQAGKIIAGHANHPSFTPEEAVHYAFELRRHGAIIDVSTLDCVHTRWRNGPHNLDALVDAGLVDTLSTDFAGGDWDSILAAIQRIVTRHQMSAAAAVALATGNVARTFPALAGDRGLIAKGKRADLAICESHNLARVRHVLINGRVVVLNGAIVETRHGQT